MHSKSKFKSTAWDYLPLFGLTAFVILYLIAALLYPGGSQANKHSHSFSWAHNYWCNLLSETAINGETNMGRPYALAAMGILCLTLAIFWIRFFEQCKFGMVQKRIMQGSAIASMAVSFFLFTRYHDMVIVVAGVFGIILLVGMHIGLLKGKAYFLFGLGLVNCLLFGLNNYMYYGDHYYYLPVVQKITLVIFFTWIGLISITMTRSSEARQVS